MENREEVFGDLEKAQQGFYVLVESFRTLQFKNPDSLNKSDVKLPMQLLRGTLDLSMHDIVRVLGLTAKSRDIYFPYGAKSEAEFLKYDLIKKIKLKSHAMYD